MRHEGNPNNPHSILLFVTGKVAEHIPGGHLSPNKIQEEQKVFAIKCHDRDQAKMRLTQILEELQAKWPA